MDSTLNILLIEPYYAGSHKKWADDLITCSRHNIRLLHLKGQHWKWRMQAASIPLAAQANALTTTPDLLICSDMMDLSLFKSLLKKRLRHIPVVYYMHENQLTYPYAQHDRDKEQDFHYGFINYKSCLVADHAVFNSLYHKNVFLDALQQLLQRLPDHRSLDTLDGIRHKTDILPIGIEKEKILKLSANYKRDNTLPVLLWNHRWEHDKRPDLFVQLCTNLRKEGKKFKINFIGKSSGQCADLLQKFKHDFQDDILNWGHVDSYDAYLKILMSSDILPVCSEHDFFGIAVLEGMYAGNTPILPAGMVYEEHFTSDPSDYLYNGFDGLAERCLAAINKRDSFDPGLLKDYNKTKVISMYDRFFEGCVL